MVHSFGSQSSWQSIPVPEDLGPGRVYPFTVDSQGVVTILGRDIPLGTSTYELLAARYTPGVGWDSERIETTKQFFQTIRVTTDNQDNVIVIYDRKSTAGFPQPWHVIYDSATGNWGSPEPIASTSYSPYVPALLRTPSGNAVRLVYFNPGPPAGASEQGVFMQTWKAKTKTWTSPDYLPYSERLEWFALGGVASLPAAMDGSGNVMLAWNFRHLSGLPSVVGSRFSNGSWEKTFLLLPWWSPIYVNMVDGFSHADASPAGDFLAVQTGSLPLWLGGHLMLVAFHYDPDRGWLHTRVPYVYGQTSITHTRVSWYGTGKAVASLADFTRNQQVSAVYTGTKWDEMAAPIDSLSGATFQELESWGNDVLVVFERLAEGQQGVAARWLK